MRRRRKKAVPREALKAMEFVVRAMQPKPKKCPAHLRDEPCPECGALVET
jgi:hypothetical protein